MRRGGFLSETPSDETQRQHPSTTDELHLKFAAELFKEWGPPLLDESIQGNRPLVLTMGEACNRNRERWFTIERLAVIVSLFVGVRVHPARVTPAARPTTTHQS